MVGTYNVCLISCTECVVSFDKIQGKCFVAFEKQLEIDLPEWSAEAPDRFYASEKYDYEESSFVELSELDLEKIIPSKDVPTERPKIKRLATMDVFCGSGGILTPRLHSFVSVTQFHSCVTRCRLVGGT